MIVREDYARFPFLGNKIYFIPRWSWRAPCARHLRFAKASGEIESLKAEGRTKLRTNVMPFARRHAFINGEGGGIGEVRISNPCPVHGFFQCERNQAVHLPRERRGSQIILRTLVAKTQNIAGLRLIERVVQIELPSCVAPGSIRAKDPSERKTYVDEPAHRPYRPLRSQHRIPAVIQPKEHGGRAIVRRSRTKRTNGRSQTRLAQRRRVVEVRIQTAHEIPAQVRPAPILRNHRNVPGRQLDFSRPASAIGTQLCAVRKCSFEFRRRTAHRGVAAQRNVGSPHHHFPVPLNPAENQLSRNYSRRLVQLPLQNQTCLYLGTSGICALLFSITKLIRNIRRIISIRGHDHCKFRLDENVARSSDLVSHAKPELRRTLVQRSKTQAEPSGLEQVRQGRRSEGRPVLSEHSENVGPIVESMIHASKGQPDRRHARPYRRNVPVQRSREVAFEIELQLPGDRGVAARQVWPFEICAQAGEACLRVELRTPRRPRIEARS